MHRLEPLTCIVIDAETLDEDDICSYNDTNQTNNQGVFKTCPQLHLKQDMKNCNRTQR